MSATAFAIDAKQLHKRFSIHDIGGKVEALKGVSLQVPIGSISALVGPDGAGKTTFLRLIAGLISPEQGNLNVLGLEVARAPQAVQERISYMPQRFGLYEDLSVQENLDLYCDLYNLSPSTCRARCSYLLEMMGLSPFTERPAGKLSGGMKQKLGLACTLLRTPELLLLDEPTAGVDPLSRRQLWSIIEQLVEKEHLSVLVTTAYLDEAERCKQVHVLHQGTLLDSGTPSQISRHAEGLCFTVKPDPGEAVRYLQTRLLERSETVLDAIPHAGRVRLICHSTGDLERFRSEFPQIEPVPPRLEDGFMVLLRRHAEPLEPNPVALPSLTPLLHTPSKPKPIIEVRDLVRQFGNFTAVDRTSFSVERGEIFGLLGPNGAGKTTTFRVLCGLLPPTSGFAQVDGLDLRTASAKARAKIGYVSQKFALYSHLSIRENLQFFGRSYGIDGKQLSIRIDQLLEQFKLKELEKDSAGRLPGGMKQRLAMAVGLLHKPALLFLDEPTSGADPLARRHFWRQISALALSGTTIVITTHFMEEAEYCDRLIIQDAGRLVALGTPEQVRQQAGDATGHLLEMEEAFIRIVEQARTPIEGQSHL